MTETGAAMRHQVSRSSLDRALTYSVKVALAVALIAGGVEAAVTASAIRAHWDRSPARDQRQLSHELAIDVAVVRRIATVIPPTATYELVVAHRLASSEVGSAFHAFVRARLLPRVETKRNGEWQIEWGLPAPESCCSHVVPAGAPFRGSPPVYVVRNG
jgi:hypothetical protein